MFEARDFIRNFIPTVQVNRFYRVLLLLRLNEVMKREKSAERIHFRIFFRSHLAIRKNSEKKKGGLEESRNTYVTQGLEGGEGALSGARGCPF